MPDETPTMMDTEKTDAEKASPFNTEVTLPSRGKFYADGPETVTLRPMTVKEEKLLYGRGDRMKMADQILEECIVDCDMPLPDYLMTDKYFLLLQLRAISYGAEYECSIPCTTDNCTTSIKKVLRIPDDLKIRQADDDDCEPFSITLPLCGKKVSLRFLRGFDEKDIEDYVKQMPAAQLAEPGDPSYSYRMSKFIVAIDDEEPDAIEKLSFVESLVGRDSMVIRKKIAEQETGPIMFVDCACPVCQREFRTDLPITQEFFLAGATGTGDS